MWMPLPGIALYSATKAYVKTFSVAFAKEARERNVWVTAVSPAGVATDFYGLSHRLQKVGLAIGVLMTPDKVARKALRALFRHRKHLIPGWYNRLFIRCSSACRLPASVWCATRPHASGSNFRDENLPYRTAVAVHCRKCSEKQQGAVGRSLLFSNTLSGII